MKLTIWIANPSSIQAQSSETYYKTNPLDCQSKVNPSPIQAQPKPNVENILCFQQFGRADLPLLKILKQEKGMGAGLRRLGAAYALKRLLVLY